MAVKRTALGSCSCSGSGIVFSKYSLERKYFLNESCSKNGEKFKRLRGRLEMIAAIPRTKIHRFSWQVAYIWGNDDCGKDLYLE